MKEVTTLIFTLEELNELIDSRIQKALQNRVEKVWMSEKEAKEYTGFSQFTLYNARINGELKASKCNRSVRYHRDDLDAWLRKNKTIKKDSTI
ncbi:helix-turn-helix domain-containing protein [Exiguobacterium sp. s144]|uniref:helix-turn-helix domain-containing protein n=1 Tax=Exiguobacterium sp. s144 TaxID=2751195 RepID=UPI001BEA0927|nr:helix-turn-helix domain-containing protein [Exiguobacterium sp. s144]